MIRGLRVFIRSTQKFKALCMDTQVEIEVDMSVQCAPQDICSKNRPSCNHKYPHCLHRRASKSSSFGHHPPNEFCSRKPIPIQIQQQTNNILTTCKSQQHCCHGLSHADWWHWPRSICLLNHNKINWNRKPFLPHDFKPLDIYTGSK